MGRLFHIVRTPHSIPDQFPDYRRSNRPASCFPDSIGPLVSPPSTPDSQHHTPRNGTSKNSPVKKPPYVDVYLEFQHRHRPHQPCAECAQEKTGALTNNEKTSEPYGSKVFHLANALNIELRQVCASCCLNRLESKIDW